MIPVAIDISVDLCKEGNTIVNNKLQRHYLVDGESIGISVDPTITMQQEGFQPVKMKADKVVVNFTVVDEIRELIDWL